LGGIVVDFSPDCCQAPCFRRAHALEHGHAAVGAGVDIHMAAGAAGLADDLQARQLFK
jgi:hypothetical protein